MVNSKSLKQFEPKQVQRAVDALYEYLKKRENNELLSGNDEPVYLQFGVKKIPNKENQMIKIPIPHPLRKESDVCLFVKDLDKKKKQGYEETERHYKSLLVNKGVHNVSEVIPLMQLKKEYQPFEAKRNLSQLYDIFLADECIIRLLPGFLGKAFYGRKKIPVQVNLNAADLKKEISSALEMTYCYIGGKGSSFQTQVAISGFASDQTVGNIMAVVTKVAESIPGGPDNIHTVHLKTADSPALPVYVSFESASKVVIPSDVEKVKHDKPEDVTPVEDVKMYVTKSQKIVFVNPKKQKPKRKRGRSKKGDGTSKETQQSEQVGKKRKNSTTNDDEAVPKGKKKKIAQTSESDASQMSTPKKKQKKDNKNIIASPDTDKQDPSTKKKGTKKVASNKEKTMEKDNPKDTQKSKLVTKNATAKSEKKTKVKGAKKPPKAKSFANK